MSDDARIPTAALLFDKLRESEVISADCYAEVCRHIDPLLELARSIDKSAESNDWDKIRAEWSFPSQPKPVIPINAANLCPKPTKVTLALNRLRLEYNNNVSQQERTGPGAARIQEARLAIAQNLGLHINLIDPPDCQDLAIVRNTSEANNAINNGVRDWGPDDNVVIWDQNHPTNKGAWYLRAQRYRFQVREVHLPTTATAQQITNAFLGQINRNTRFVTFTETSNGNGMRIPRSSIRDLWTYLQRSHPNCHLHIDGAMTWGSQHVDLLQDLPCHSFSASAHKWFCGPKETGILYMKPEAAERLMPNVYGYDYRIVDPPWDAIPRTARRFELLGQRDDVNIIHLLTEQTFLSSIGARAIEERVRFLATHLKRELQKNGWKLVTPEEDWKSHGIVRFEAPQGDRPQSLYNYLYDNHRIAGSGDSETFRLCPHIYNNVEDLDLAITGMSRWRG